MINGRSNHRGTKNLRRSWTASLSRLRQMAVNSCGWRHTGNRKSKRAREVKYRSSITQPGDLGVDREHGSQIYSTKRIGNIDAVMLDSRWGTENNGQELFIGRVHSIWYVPSVKSSVII